MKFIDSDGNLYDHAALIGRDGAGNDIFSTVVGMSGIDGVPTLRVAGKEIYKRVLIRLVHPVKYQY